MVETVQTRDAQIGVRLTKEQRTEVEKMATAARMHVGALIRALLDRELSRWKAYGTILDRDAGHYR